MITLDGRHINEFGYRAYMDHVHPATPDISNKTMKIPGRAGEWDFGAELGSRPFDLTIRAMDMDDNLLQQKQNEFIAYLFDAYGKPKEMMLVFDYEPDKYYIARVSNSITPSNIAKIIRYNGLPLVAYDPYKYSKATADEVTWGSEDITFEADYLLGHENDFADEYVKITGNDTLVTTVSGIAIKPIFMINGTANNLTVSANGHSFSLPNFSNTKWEIDFEKYLVRRNGQETMLEINDFYLMPGSNEISITGSNINIEMAIKYHDKYN